MSRLDVLVAGGGPCGLAVAIAAARAGLSAAVVEPRRGDLDKACGEGLMPGAVAALGRLGVEVTGRPFAGIRYVDGEWRADAPFAQGAGRGVRRTALHRALADRADALGVPRLEGRVEAVEQTADEVRAAGLRARWLVAADGLRSPLRRRLGLEAPPRGPARLGLRRHFRAAPWSPFVEVHWTEHVEAYVTPVAADEVGVAFLFAAGAAPARHERLLERFPAIAARLGAPTSGARGAGPFEQRVRRRVAGRVLLAGDAAGYLDPLTGEGLSLGFATAEALADCLRRGAPEDYERAWRALARRSWWLTAGLLALATRPPLRRRLVPTLQRAPWLMRAAVRLLEGDGAAPPPR